MANTFSCLNIHCVFSTKQRVAVLSPDIRERLWPYIGGIAKQNVGDTFSRHFVPGYDRSVPTGRLAALKNVQTPGSPPAPASSSWQFRRLRMGFERS